MRRIYTISDGRGQTDDAATHLIMRTQQLDIPFRHPEFGCGSMHGRRVDFSQSQRAIDVIRHSLDLPSLLHLQFLTLSLLRVMSHRVLLLLRTMLLQVLLVVRVRRVGSGVHLSRVSAGRVVLRVHHVRVTGLGLGVSPSLRVRVRLHLRLMLLRLLVLHPLCRLLRRHHLLMLRCRAGAGRPRRVLPLLTHAPHQTVRLRWRPDLLWVG